jgi:hypothetical protein
MTFQISWYIKRIPNGPGRRALVGTERFEQFAEMSTRAKDLLNEGMEVRILPLEVKG